MSLSIKPGANIVIRFCNSKKYSTKAVTEESVNHSFGTVYLIMGAVLTQHDVMSGIGPDPDIAILMPIGALGISLGLSFLSAGIPLQCIGSSRMNWIAEDYNQKHSNVAQLSFGPTMHGVGLTLSF